MRILAGDIGATNARLAVVEAHGDELSVLEERHFRSNHHEGLEPILQDFVSGLPQVPDRACLGIPGPVVNGWAHLPILGWEVREEALARATGIRELRILNDFQVLARSVPLLPDDDLATLHEGAASDPEAGRGTLAVVGAGTGLGHAYLTWTADGFRVHPSEGGHVDFAPRTPLEWDLRQHLAQRYGRVSCERIVSGPGLTNIYRFLVDSGWAPESPEVRERMAEEDPAGVISALGMEGADPVCSQALDLFISAFGSQAGDVALMLRAEGGVYLAGGIAPRILPNLRNGSFMDSFLDKGRLTPFLERIPVRVILNPRAGLLGAAAVVANG